MMSDGVIFLFFSSCLVRNLGCTKQVLHLHFMPLQLGHNNSSSLIPACVYSSLCA